jgi:large subunit ribosomal protein L15
MTKIVAKSAKRIGRGPGSGKGKTSGRGTKGQNARSRLSLTHSHFEGGQRPLMKRLPYRKGKGNSKISTKPITINLGALASFGKNEVVDLESLIKKSIITKNDTKKFGVKILGGGEIKNTLIIKVNISKKAALKIEKAGGKVENVHKI